MGRESKNCCRHCWPSLHGTLSEKGKGVGPPRVFRDQLYSNSLCFNSSLLVSKLVFVERKGMGGALLYSTRNHKPAPRVRVQNVPRLQTTPCGLGRPLGQARELSYYIV